MRIQVAGTCIVITTVLKRADGMAGKAICIPARPLWIEGRGMIAGEDPVWKLPEQGCQQS